MTTQLQGAPADNVLPTTAEAVVNCRILPDETVRGTTERLRQVIADPGVDLSLLEQLGEGGHVPLTGAVPDAVRAAAHKLWGRTLTEEYRAQASDLDDADLRGRTARYAKLAKQLEDELSRLGMECGPDVNGE